jgi:plasmid maintenance system killer protein
MRPGRLEDLRVLPGSHLEALKADRAGPTQHIRINDQWENLLRLMRWRGACRGETHGQKTKLLDPIHPGEILNESS